MSDSETLTPTSPFEQIGGEAGVRRLAEVFYDIMDANPDFHALRAMHEPDLAPMRTALAGFLTAWLGGPRDWIEQRGGFCIMSRHAGMGITAITSRQWLAAMRQAIARTGTPPALAVKLDQALTRLGEAMVQDRRG
ncbi:group II truncated hemoglobin [Acidocella sp.]|uniref:group II truncated hemoglobin n=1 Tax=Acidocella sp. TaxID=50710 RepID=UPI0026346B6B|nr:group II truncated hemoglobin [Acidocella sp.]